MEKTKEGMESLLALLRASSSDSRVKLGACLLLMMPFGSMNQSKQSREQTKEQKQKRT